MSAEARTTGWTHVRAQGLWTWRAVAWAGLAAAVLALFAPAIETSVAHGRYRDFEWHGESAARTAQTGRFETPHFLYQALLLAVNVFRREPDWVGTGIAIVLAAQVVLAILLARALEQALSVSTRRSVAAGAVLAVALMTVAPINLLSWPERNLYLGYVGINPYHNPTLLLLRPLALAHWLLLGVALEGKDAAASPRRSVALALLGVAATLAKPSYAVVLAPALVVVAVWRRWRGLPLDVIALGAGCVLPMVATLAWQYAFHYGSGETALVWAPLSAMAPFPGTPARVLLSAAYPAVAAVVFWKAARREPRLWLAWYAFACGLLYSYLLGETGWRAGHGNLLWSAQIALFLLFVTTTLIVLREGQRAQRGRSVRLGACAAAFVLHLVSGAYFLLHPTWL